MKDEELLSAFAHFQEQIEKLSIRFRDLRNKAYDLYKENEALKKENKELKRLLFDKETKEDKEQKGKGYSNLIHLYDEGYHICHLSFGEKREGDCLFCLQLLENKFEE